MNRRKNKKVAAQPIGYIVIFLLAFAAGYKVHEQMNSASPAVPINVKEHVRVYFSPRGGCTDAIVRSIEQAKESIYIFAFAFTSKRIAEALVRAALRGVAVRIVADKGQSRSKWSKLSYLRSYGIPIWIDKTSGYAHNKIIIIDLKKVIGGSFNFSDSAEYRNAENLTIILSSSLASIYLDNWHMRMKNGYPYSSQMR